MWDFSAFAVIGGIWLLVGLLYYVWLLWSLSQLFPRLGLPSSDGWIPIWNQWQLIKYADYPGWLILLVLVPGVGALIVLVVWILTLARINSRFGLGAGYTVLGVFLAPVWAMALTRHLEAAGHGAAGAAPRQTPYAPPGFRDRGAPGDERVSVFQVGVANGQTPPQQPAATTGTTYAPPVAPAGASHELPPVPQPHASPAKDWGFSNTTEDAYAELAAQPSSPRPQMGLQHEVPRPYAWPETTPNGSPLAAPPSAARPKPDESQPVAPQAQVPPRVDDAELPEGTEGFDEEDERTIVVPRRARWGIELPGGEVLELVSDEVIVGRKPTGEGTLLKIADPTRTVSKTHALFRRAGDTWTIEDLDSTNGVALINEDNGTETIDPNTPAEVAERVLIGTLEVTLVEISPAGR